VHSYCLHISILTVGLGLHCQFHPGPCSLCKLHPFLTDFSDPVIFLSYFFFINFWIRHCHHCSTVGVHGSQYLRTLRFTDISGHSVTINDWFEQFITVRGLLRGVLLRAADYAVFKDVYVSRSGFLTERPNLSSKFFYHLAAPIILVFAEVNRVARFGRVTPNVSVIYTDDATSKSVYLGNGAKIMPYLLLNVNINLYLSTRQTPLQIFWNISTDLSKPNFAVGHWRRMIRKVELI